MTLIVGLGNPGSEYANTRHNFGYRLINLLASNLELTWSAQKSLHGDIAKGSNHILLKPSTFMNNSGLSVKRTLEYYQLQNQPQTLWILHDELDLPFGSFKIHQDKSAAGHNGVQSIINHLHSQEFTRWRLGIGRPPAQTIPAADYVLQKFTPAEEQQLTAQLEQLVESLTYALQTDITKASAKYNK